MPKSKKSGKYAATTWGGEILVDLECPSGQLCQVRRLGANGLMRAGLLDSLDSLTGLVQTEHIDRVKRGESTEVDTEAVKALVANKDKLEEAFLLADKVVIACVAQPELTPVPEDPDAPRDPELVYVDAVDLVDKMFIFQFVMGGSQDLQQFRTGLGKTMAGLELGEDVPGAPQPALADQG